MVNEKFSVGTQLLPPNDDEAEIQVSLFPFRPFFRKMDGVPKSPRIIMSLMNRVHVITNHGGYEPNSGPLVESDFFCPTYPQFARNQRGHSLFFLLSLRAITIPCERSL